MGIGARLGFGRVDSRADVHGTGDCDWEGEWVSRVLSKKLVIFIICDCLLTFRCDCKVRVLAWQVGGDLGVTYIRPGPRSITWDTPADGLERQQCGEIILAFRGVMSGDIPFPRVGIHVMLLPPPASGFVGKRCRCVPCRNQVRAQTASPIAMNYVTVVTCVISARGKIGENSGVTGRVTY